MERMAKRCRWDCMGCVGCMWMHRAWDYHADPVAVGLHCYMQAPSVITLQPASSVRHFRAAHIHTDPP